MMIRYFVIHVILCYAAMSARVEAEEAERGVAVEALAGNQPHIEKAVQPPDASAEIATQKSVSSESVIRDPFWPVGYVPPTEKKIDDLATTSTPIVVEPQFEPLEWDAAIKSLIIKGIMKSGAGYMAVINGQVASENDTISAVFKGRTYNWRVAKIDQKGVQFQRLETAQ